MGQVDGSLQSGLQRAPPSRVSSAAGAVPFPQPRFQCCEQEGMIFRIILGRAHEECTFGKERTPQSQGR